MKGGQRKGQKIIQNIMAENFPFWWETFISRPKKFNERQENITCTKNATRHIIFKFIKAKRKRKSWKHWEKTTHFIEGNDNVIDG